MSSEDMDFSEGKDKKKPESNGSLVEFGEFKGKATIILKRTPDDPYPFSFGLSKAKLILDNIQAIEHFVDKKGS